MDIQEDKTPVKVWEKHPKNPKKGGAAKGGSADSRVTNSKKPVSRKPKGNDNKKEARPDDQRAPEEFMEMGGRGDQPLFGNDNGSRYTVNP